MTRRRIVVFGEHTPAATAALRWAIGEAEKRDAAVVVVRPFDQRGRADLALERDLDRARRDARYRTQAWVVETVDGLDTPVTISVSTPDGSAPQALVTAAQGADLVVIGDCGAESERLAATVRDVGGCQVRLVPRPQRIAAAH